MNPNKRLQSRAYDLKEIAQTDADAVLDLLGSGENGLSHEDAQSRMAEYGPNEIEQQKAPAWVVQLLQAFLNPFILILIAIAVISWIIDVLLAAPGDGDYMTVIIVSIMVVLSALLRFVQEFRSNREAEQLKTMVRTTAAVVRAGEEAREIPMADLVPGDLVRLAAGDMMPADCRIIQSTDLFVSESMLTGESLPVEKTFRRLEDAGSLPVTELSNICFMGTNVVSGAATAVIIRTGNRTYFGDISKKIAGKRPVTSFDKGVNKVSFLLIRFMLVMVPLIFLINGLLKDDWMEALLFAIAVAVGLTPEMLPMIVSGNLAKGAVQLSKEKVIVKHLNSIQNIGAMDVLCTDKTGTLTLDKIVVETFLNVAGVEDEEVLKWAYLNSYHQTGLRNLMDVAVLERAELHDLLKVDERYTKVDEIPFDFERRRMSVILEMQDGSHLLICKGAVEEMLDLCSHAFDPGDDLTLHIQNDEVVPMDQKMRQTVAATSDRMNANGTRVLLVAIKRFSGGRQLNYSVADEAGLTFAGFIGFLDPAKPTARPAIEDLQRAGVTVKVVTGDNETVARKISDDVGISVRHVINGSQLDELTDDALTEQIDDISVFAKLNPLQKVRVVKALRAKGHTVGFLGDGINDAAALKEADVGISVDNAVDITKESADIILLDKDLGVLYKGVINGRTTFGNIVKYIKITVSSNFGNMFSVLGASLFLPFLPMLPAHLLIQNLLYDISQTAIPWDRVDKDFIEKPKQWNASGISKFMLYTGPFSSLFDFVLFFVMWYVFKANSPADQTLFQSGWFILGLVSQVMIVHIIRTRSIPFYKRPASTPLIAISILVIVLGIMLPFSVFAPYLKLQPLPMSYFLWLAAILLSYALIMEFVKKWYIRRFGHWL